jgi:hypothetical protein
MDNSSAINWLLSERFTGYVRAEELLEQKQNHKTALESACAEQVTAHAKAEAALREVESLNAELDALLKSTPSVNYEAAVVNLLERVKPYIATNSSVRNFDKDVYEAIKLANELGLVPPEGGVFSLAAWLQDTVALWISEAQTALDYANDVVATKMTDANSSVQLSIQRSNYLAQLQQQKQQTFEEKTKLQREIEKLRSRQFKLSFAMNELEEWSSTAYYKLYKTLNQCFQEPQDLTEELISLPLGLSLLAQEIGYSHAPWNFYCKRGLTEARRLLVKHREWSTVSRIAERIYSLLVTVPPELATISPTEDAISKTINAFGIDSLHSVPALERLYQLADQTLEQINRPFHYLWDSNTETLRAHSRPYCAAAKIKAVKRQALAIVQNAKPSAIEPTLRRIADETVSSIVTSAQTWLNQLQAETEQEFRQMGEQLNEQVKLATNLQIQISATQEQIKTSRCEGDIKFRRVISLLQELVHLQQMPLPLRVLVEQYLQNPSDILRQVSTFSSTVHFWKINTEKLGTLISSLDTFAGVSTLRNAVTIEVDSRRYSIHCTFKQLTESRIKLREIEVEVQQQLENITTDRRWWQQVWQAIPAHLKPTVLTASLKANLEAVKLRIATPVELYRQCKITAGEYARIVEIKVKCLVRGLPNYHLGALPRQQNEMRHEHTNYDELIQVIRGNDRAYMLIKKRVELAILATHVGSNEYLYETKAVA